jgi:hypothetical protein
MADEHDAREQPAPAPADRDAPGQAPPSPADRRAARSRRRAARRAQAGRLISAVGRLDDAAVEDAVLRLSRSRRLFAPLAFAVGAFAMLFEGLKLLLTNWRLTLVQLLPAMWIWAAMLDLKAHLLRGRSFQVLHGPVLIPIVLAIAAITAASFFLNAVFAFAVAEPGPPVIRPAFTRARAHRAAVLGSGTVVGVCLGLSTVVLARWELWWFAVSLSIVIAVMMICYVAVPARLIGVKTRHSRRDKLAATIVGGTIGAIVCTPPYLLGRAGLLMLGSRALLIPGIIVLTIGLTLEAAATSTVKAVKMSAKLISGPQPASSDQPPPRDTSSADGG